MLQLHRFMVAIARVSVNHDARVALPLTSLSGIRGVVVSKQRKVDVRVDVDLAMLPGPPVFFARAVGSGAWWLHIWCSYCCLGPSCQSAV